VWTDWHVHRLDWFPGETIFYVDDNKRNSTSLHVPVPDPMTQLYIDMWGANSSWVGVMPLGGEATLDIQWVEVLFNSTTRPNLAQGTARKVCVPDHSDVGGNAVSAGTRIISRNCYAVLVWVLASLLVIWA